MWVLWLICAVLVIIAMALLIKPLFKTYSETELVESQKKVNQRKNLNIELYEQKKVQIEQDFSNGLLDEEGRIQAQNEIEHSLIQDAESSAAIELTQLSNSGAKKLAVFFLIIIPVFSVITYIAIMPENFQQLVAPEPAARSTVQSHTAGGQKQVPDIASMVTSLEKKLQKNPDNAQGWNMLGRSYVVMKRYAEAAVAYEKALALVKQNKAQPMPELEVNYAEALMQTGKKEAYQKARTLLDEMLAANPDNGDALWFMGFLDYEAGNKALAVEHWTHLLSLLPANGEQAQIVMNYLNQINPGAAVAANNQAAETARTSNQPQAQTKPAASGPASGQQLTGSAEEQAFIASMVSRVEQRVKENPQDLKGWKSLGKSYGVLNRHIDSAEAYGKAVALDSSDAGLLMDYSDAVIKTGDRDQLDKARIVFAQLIDQNPQNLDALFLSGSLARVAGDQEEAKKFWGMLLPQLSPGSKAYINVESNLNSL